MPLMRPLTMTRSWGTPFTKVSSRNRRSRRRAPMALPLALPMNA